MKLSRLRLWLQ